METTKNGAAYLGDLIYATTREDHILLTYESFLHCYASVSLRLSKDVLKNLLDHSRNFIKNSEEKQDAKNQE